VPRLAIVASHPIQYQAPWFRELAKVVDLEVFFCHRQDAAGQAAAGFGVPFEWDVPLLDGYASHWLRNVARRPSTERFSGCDTPEIDERLGAGRFDACIVSGWYLKSYIQATRACWRRGIKVLVRGDSHLNVPRSRVKSAAKYLPYRWFLNRIDAHLFVGAANRAYLRAYGVPDGKLFFVPHFVDNAFFASRADRARTAGEASRIRHEFGIPSDGVAFLFAGRLVEMKHPDHFIRACALVGHVADSRVHGIVVGDGPLRPELESLAAASGAPVSFAGFKNQTAVPAYYAAADAMVLPSDGRETWGLVVNEGMACGLPVIVSGAAGCVGDLVEHGVNGFVFPKGDIDRLAECMRATMAADRRRMGNAARARVKGYAAPRAVAGTVEALAAVLDVRRVRASSRGREVSAR
jgi:glycosyltransferase involved in cell wall biosynthesis